MRKAWFKLTRNATGRQLLWELVTTESGASGYRTTGRINLKRHQMKNLTHVSVEDIERKAWGHHFKRRSIPEPTSINPMKHRRAHYALSYGFYFYQPILGNRYSQALRIELLNADIQLQA